MRSKPSVAAERATRSQRADPRERILDVAQTLFATAGYAGTTTRDIARRARIKLGQLHYYFASKRALFEAVVSRLGRTVTERRRLLLAEAKRQWPKGDIPVEVLVEALVRSLLLDEPNGRKGSRLGAATQLHARLQTDPDETASAVRAAIYDETTLSYVDAFCRALPGLPPAVIWWRIHFMMGAYVWTMLGPGRLAMISRGRADPGDLDIAVREIVPFLCAGLTAAPPEGPSRATRLRRAKPAAGRRSATARG